MTFPPPRPPSNAPSSSTDTRSRFGLGAWGSSHVNSSRRELSPISTTLSNSRPPTASQDLWSRSPWSPNPPSIGANSGTASLPEHNARSPSVTSPPPGIGIAPPPGFSHATSKSRITAAVQNGQQASPTNATSASGGFTSSSGGTSSRVFRASPSLSQSSYTSPTTSAVSGPPGNSQAGSVNKIVTTQLFLLLSTIRDVDKDKAKWDTEADKIRKLVNSHGMEVFTKYIRRLIVTNASTIWATTSRGADHSYPLLVEEMQKISQDSQQASKIVECIDEGDGDVFKDFDLSGFMEHFKMSSIDKITLASACKKASKTDLRTKADAIITSNLQHFLQAISRPIAPESYSQQVDLLATVVDRLAQFPPRNWTTEVQQGLENALQSRFQLTGKAVPWEITSAFYMFDLVTPNNPLVRLVRKLGPKAFESVSAVKQLLDQAEGHENNPEQVASALLFMVIARDEQPYNAKHFVSALLVYRAGQRLDWREVIRSFDRNALTINKQQFKGLFDALLLAARANDDVDLQLLWGGHWRHELTQLTFVGAFLSHSQDELDASQIPHLRRAFDIEDFQSASDPVKAYAEQVTRHPYVSLDAIKALLPLAFEDHAVYDHALKCGIIDRAVNTHLTLFVGSASAVPQNTWSQVQDMAIRTLFEKIVALIAQRAESEAGRDVRDCDFALHLLWRNHKPWVANSIYKFYQKNSLFLGTILDVAHSHGMLDDLIAAKNELSLDLAALAHGRFLFDLDPWLLEIATEMPSETVTPALCQFLSGKAQDEIAVRNAKLAGDTIGHQTVPLRVRTAHSILGFLGKQNLQETERIELQRSAISAYPRLINYDQGFDDIIDANGATNNACPPETDAKMQEYYRRMWNGEQGVEDIIAVLRRLKVSRDHADQDLFACMIFGLFDEYHCFAQYPQQALADTAVLFGSIIDFKLLSNIALQVAISMVLEAVREYQPDALMFKFGLQALVRFEGRLEEWTRLCETLLEIPGLKDTQIYPVLEDISSRKPAEDQADVKVNGEAADDFLANEPEVAAFTSLSVDPPDEDAQDPDENQRDAIHFVFNSLIQDNVEEKAAELKSAIKPENHQWFAQHFIEQRVKPGLNYQPLFITMLDLIGDPDLWAAVIRASYASVIQLLNADTTMAQAGERKVMKEMAGWLGTITLARNQAIKYRNISFRDLLIEARETERLLVAIPFTCKVLATVAQSVVFQPPCAWTMEILEILVELYHFAEMKLNLKFEIEVLCKTLSLDHKEIEPAMVIRSKALQEPEPLADLPGDDVDPFADNSLVGFSRRLADRFSPSTFIPQDLTSLLKHSYPPPPGEGHVQEEVRSLLTEATERAVADIIGAVVERSVTIASIAACQITMKDFALEPDINKVRESAQTAVRSLAGSLAAVTCKEPLRNQMLTNIGQLRQTIPEELLPPAYMQIFVNDNLDSVCGVVEKAAADASVDEINAQLEEAGAVQDREAADFGRDVQVSHWANFIPMPFKLSVNGLTREQLAIYEEFDRTTPGALTQALNAAQENNRSMVDMLQDQFTPNFPSTDNAVDHTAASRRLPEPTSHSAPMVNGFANGPSAEERIVESVRTLIAAVQEAPDLDSTRVLHGNPAIENAWNALNENIHAVDAHMIGNTTIIVSREISQVLYEGPHTTDVLDVLAVFMKHVSDMSDTTKEVVLNWCNDFDEQRFFNTGATVALLKVDLLDVHRLDLVVAAGLWHDRPGMFGFFKDLVSKAFLTQRAAIWRSDFANSITVLSECIASDRNVERAREIIEQLGGPFALPDGLAGESGAADEVQMAYIFEEWVRFQCNVDHSQGEAGQAPNRQYASISFVRHLHEQRAFSDRGKLATFIKASIRSCVEADRHGAYEAEPPSTKPDALARLIALMLSIQPKVVGSPKAGKLEWLETSLFLVAMVYAQCIKHGLATFSQRPIFRFYSSLIYELQAQSRDRDEALLVVAKNLLFLQPSKFPTFAFSWLSLLSHRAFMLVLLGGKNGPAGRDTYCELAVIQITYIADLMQGDKISLPAKELYQGTLKYLLVLHHDFPDFVADYAFQLLRPIPSFCSQMRSLIVSASPSTLSELPDPFAPGLKVERLEHAKYNPEIAGDYDRVIATAGIEDALSAFYAKAESSSPHIDAVFNALAGSGKGGSSLDKELIDALLITLPSRTGDTQPYLFFSEDSPTVMMLAAVIERLDYEARYHVLSAMASHLRFPCSFTAFYSQMFLHFFRGDNSEQNVQMEIQQQILRVMMERIVAARPHSWGLIVTLVELLKNGNYRLFDMPFVKSAPEIERMLSQLLAQMGSVQRQAV